MEIKRSLAVLSALLIRSHHTLVQEVTVPGRVLAQPSSLMGNH
jgi:hypothetical protein